MAIRRHRTSLSRILWLSTIMMIKASLLISSSLSLWYNDIFVIASGTETSPANAVTPQPPTIQSPLTTVSDITSHSKHRTSSRSSLPSSSPPQSCSSLVSLRVTSIISHFIKLLTPLTTIFKRSFSSTTTSTTSFLVLLKSISLHCFRLFLAGYIASTTYHVLKEIWDDVYSDLLTEQHIPKDVREEQDMPYFTSFDHSLFDISDRMIGHDENDMTDDESQDVDIIETRKSRWFHRWNHPRRSLFHYNARKQQQQQRRRRRQQQQKRQQSSEFDDMDDTDASKVSSFQKMSPMMMMTPLREMAQRLHSAGLPYESEIRMMDRERGAHATSLRQSTTVEDILQSLTRAEGNILSQTLLSPLDDDDDDDGIGMIDEEEEETEEEEGEKNGMIKSVAAQWNAIGGLSDAKESLLDLAFPLLLSTRSATASKSLTSNNAYSQANNYEDNNRDCYGGLLTNPPGVLLFGPPGCGKGMLVRALASTIHARFLTVSPSVLLRKYVGETNLNVRALFSLARKLSPTVIFVDELDGLFRERGGEDHDVSRDLKTEFLQLWDGIRNRHGSSDSTPSPILIIGATNRPFDVDPAFLRRMPRKVYVGLPNYDSRLSVLEGMLRHVPLDAKFDIALVAKKTAGYSPSDIREVLQMAALYPLREARSQAFQISSTISSDSKNDEDDGNKMGYVNKKLLPMLPPLRRLRTEDVLQALEVSKPTHFSRKYWKDLMHYVQNTSGISSSYRRELDEEHDVSLPSVPNPNENFHSTGNFFREERFNQLEQSEQHEMDEGTSESDSDGL